MNKLRSHYDPRATALAPDDVSGILHRLAVTVDNVNPHNPVSFIVEWLVENYTNHLPAFASIWCTDRDLQAERLEVASFFAHHKICAGISSHFINAGYDTIETLSTLHYDELIDIENFNRTKWLPGHKVRLAQIFETIDKSVEAWRNNFAAKTVLALGTHNPESLSRALSRVPPNEEEREEVLKRFLKYVEDQKLENTWPPPNGTLPKVVLQHVGQTKQVYPLQEVATRPEEITSPEQVEYGTLEAMLRTVTSVFTGAPSVNKVSSAVGQPNTKKYTTSAKLTPNNIYNTVQPTASRTPQNGSRISLPNYSTNNLYMPSMNQMYPMNLAPSPSYSMQQRSSTPMMMSSPHRTPLSPQQMHSPMQSSLMPVHRHYNIH